MIAVAVQFQDGGVVDEPVDGCHGDGLVWEDFVPGAEGLVGCHGKVSGR